MDGLGRYTRLTPYASPLTAPAPRAGSDERIGSKNRRERKWDQDLESAGNQAATIFYTMTFMTMQKTLGIYSRRKNRLGKFTIVPVAVKRVTAGHIRFLHVRPIATIVINWR